MSIRFGPAHPYSLTSLPASMAGNHSKGRRRYDRGGQGPIRGTGGPREPGDFGVVEFDCDAAETLRSCLAVQQQCTNLVRQSAALTAAIPPFCGKKRT